MKITRNAVAGTLESSDIFIEVSPGGQGISIELESIVMNQFGQSIRAVMMEVLQQMGVEAAAVRANDKGALECVIRARLETALLRAGEGEDV